MNTTGIRRPAATSCSCSSNPLSPPRWTSRTRQPGVRGLRQSRKSSADEYVLTWNPPASRRRRRARRSETSSSTTHTNCERSPSRDEAEANRPSLSSNANLEPVASPRHALLVPYGRADRPGRPGLGVGHGRRAVARQLDAEREPSVRVGLGQDAPPVRLNDRAADCQAHAEAARLGTDEPLERALELCGLRPDAGVT